MHPNQRLKDRFADNLCRVRGLIAASTRLTEPGRTRDDDVPDDNVPDDNVPGDNVPGDTLRAAVVLLHASTEDLLRALESLTLEQADPATLESFNLCYAPPTPGTRPIEKLSLPALARAYPGASIAEVTQRAIAHALDHANYNNLEELISVLQRLAIRPKPLMDRFAEQLAAMMRRRHWIAHRADHMEATATDSTSPVLTPIHQVEVESWVDAVERFGEQILNQYVRRAA